MHNSSAYLFVYIQLKNYQPHWNEGKLLPLTDNHAAIMCHRLKNDEKKPDSRVAKCRRCHCSSREGAGRWNTGCYKKELGFPESMKKSGVFIAIYFKHIWRKCITRNINSVHRSACHKSNAKPSCFDIKKTPKPKILCFVLKGVSHDR